MNGYPVPCWYKAIQCTRGIGWGWLTIRREASDGSSDGGRRIAVARHGDGSPTVSQGQTLTRQSEGLEEDIIARGTTHAHKWWTGLSV